MIKVSKTDKLFLVTTYNLTQRLVGDGVASPTYADDSVRPRRKVPSDMGLAMPAPTNLCVKLYVVTFFFVTSLIRA